METEFAKLANKPKQVKLFPKPGTQTVAWRSLDGNGDDLSYMIKLSALGEDTWVTLAEDVRLRDQEVDQMYVALFREFLTFMMEDPRNISSCMHYHFIAKNIERMGDHIVAIADQTIYQVTGNMPEEARPKGMSSIYDVPMDDT